MHDLHGVDWIAAVNVAANAAIVAGYLVVPLTVLRRLPLTRPVLIAGAAFFATCAVTHAGMALRVGHLHPVMVANHIVQAVAVVAFVAGFYQLLGAAHRRRGGGDDSRAGR